MAEDEDIVQIEWHELLDRAQTMRSKASQSIFEQKRKVYIEKSVEIVERDDFDVTNIVEQNRIK